MWRQLQIGALILFCVFAALTLYCQLRCGMLGGKLSRGEATEKELSRMRAQGGRAAACALASLLGCIACGAAGMR